MKKGYFKRKNTNIVINILDPYSRTGSGGEGETFSWLLHSGKCV
jgi:phosphoribosylanthranilate isomerase